VINYIVKARDVPMPKHHSVK